MRRTKRILAFLLAGTLMFSNVAYAAENDGSDTNTTGTTELSALTEETGPDDVITNEESDIDTNMSDTEVDDTDTDTESDEEDTDETEKDSSDENAEDVDSGEDDDELETTPADDSEIVEPVDGTTGDVPNEEELLGIDENSVQLFQNKLRMGQKESHTVTLKPLGNSAKYNYHDYLDHKCDTPSEVEVEDGGTLSVDIYVDEHLGDTFVGGKPLEYITVNGERINVNGQDASGTVEDMNVTVDRTEHSWNEILGNPLPPFLTYYKVTITNVSQDIELGYFIKDRRGTDERTIQIDRLDNGIKLYVWDENEEILKSVYENDVFVLEDKGDQIYFYIKAEPGYKIENISGQGFAAYSAIDAQSNKPGISQALELGCQWEFDYTKFIWDEADRTVEIMSTPIEYTVVYYETEDSAAPEYDPKEYTVVDGKNQITLKEAPVKDGFIFKGWKLGDTSYSAKQTITVDADFIKKAVNNTFTFIGQWDKAITLTFISEHGFAGEAQSPHTMTNQVPGLSFQAPTPLDTTTDNVVFVGWDKKGIDENGEGTVPSEDTTYTAQYKEDKNNDGTPDENQYVTVTFTIAEEDTGKGTLEGTAEYKELVPGLELTVPTVNDTEGDDWVFDGWTPELDTNTEGKTIVPDEGAKYTAVWAEDKNHNGRPDDEESYTLTVSYAYAPGEEGTAALPSIHTEDNLPVGHSYNVISPALDGYVAVPAVVSGTIVDENVTEDVLYYIDANGNGIPDSQEPDDGRDEDTDDTDDTDDGDDETTTPGGGTTTPGTGGDTGTGGTGTGGGAGTGGTGTGGGAGTGAGAGAAPAPVVPVNLAANDADAAPAADLTDDMQPDYILEELGEDAADDGAADGAEIETIDEDETPLANQQLSSPKCILHWLILLAALVAAGIFLFDGHKRKKKIEELKDQLGIR